MSSTLPTYIPPLLPVLSVILPYPWLLTTENTKHGQKFTLHVVQKFCKNPRNNSYLQLRLSQDNHILFTIGHKLTSVANMACISSIDMFPHNQS
jgi:hypothetical protein